MLLGATSCSHSPTRVNSRLTELAEVADKSNDMKLESMRIKQARDYIERSFEDLKQLQTKNWTEDRITFDSLRRINFYLKDTRINILLERLYWKLRETGFATEQDAQDLYDYYLVNRQSDEAAAFYKKLPDFLTEKYRPILKISGPTQQTTGPSLLHLKSLKTADLKPFPISSFSGVVIIASPNCQYSLNALGDLQKAQKKQNHLLKSTVVVTPQQDIDYGYVLKWNQSHPNLQFKMAYHESDFAEYDFDSVPKFYFLKNGTVVHSFDGWSQEEKSLEKFKEGLTKIL